MNGYKLTMVETQCLVFLLNSYNSKSKNKFSVRCYIIPNSEFRIPNSEFKKILTKIKRYAVIRILLSEVQA
ncbi:MAG: hypothetical protein LBB88_04555 [Planctomycetaceae bacterium]|nr:hypothetical protein [Planctomycetaceae bacterium]